MRDSLVPSEQVEQCAQRLPALCALLLTRRAAPRGLMARIQRGLDATRNGYLKVAAPLIRRSVLAVGLGVDYAFYIYNRVQFHLAEGLNITDSYKQTLFETGMAVVFTAITMAVGVSTWTFSALKFQADMGLLLTFMVSINMIMAITTLPACTMLAGPAIAIIATAAKAKFLRPRLAVRYRPEWRQCRYRCTSTAEDELHERHIGNPEWINGTARAKGQPKDLFMRG